MKLVNFRRLKSAVGHEHVNVKKIDLFINHQLIKIKFTLDKIWKRQQICWQLAETALLNTRVTGDDLAACSATKNDPGDRETTPDQGGAVVPDNDVTRHEIERPETHWLVKTEVSRLIWVG